MKPLFILILYLSTNAAAEPLALTCGSNQGATDPDNRRWEPDNNYLVAPVKSVSSNALSQDASLSSDVPYMTVRIFNQETSYRFRINSTTRYILRLHFYPSNYPNYNISDSYFGVTVGPLTLLKNFSASITAEALSQAYLVKEYSLAPLNSDSLTLVFKPCDKSFAFVNAIELIAEPALFDDEAGLVGMADDAGTIDGASSNMQNMFRLNVGGQYIPPTKDSGGLMRSWYDDTPYMLGCGTITSIANITIQYRDLPAATAPLDVYRTSRSQGPDPYINKESTVTWIFQVDANFTYLVRFHLCEYELDKANQRVFEIYLNNETAIDSADVIAWTGGKGIPMRKDYAVYINHRLDSDPELWVTMHTNIDMKPEFYDILLNGLEVFKISDTKFNLAGPNPVLSDMMKKGVNTKPGAQKSIRSGLVGGAAGVAAAFGVAAAVFFVACNQKRKMAGGNSWLPLYSNSHTSNGKSNVSGKRRGGSNISTDAACNCRYFSLVEIRHATKNFDESNVIGVGGFGKVYKGFIDGNVKVAIKRSYPSSTQGVNEFVTEIEMLSKLRHRHLVSLIGFCDEGNEMVLVYDYMGKGTLREHLYKGNKTTLTWKQRVEILIGAAKGLHYLHTGAKYTFIHRDVKTTNILCDDNWVAKVSDFGLSKMGTDMNRRGHVSTVVKGSFGYLDPEYFWRQQLTEKSDVYSFGVVLFEVLCARPALNPSLPKEQVSLVDYASHCMSKGTVEEMVDPQLKGKIWSEALKKFVECAKKCISDHGTERPSMGDVLWTLEYILQMETNPEVTKETSESSRENAGNETIQVKIDQSNMMAMHHENGDGEVFSQIVNQQGR